MAKKHNHDRKKSLLIPEIKPIIWALKLLNQPTQTQKAQ